jgi:hypothetical protein
MQVPLLYEIHEAERRIHVTYCVQPTFDRWVSTMEEIFRHPRFKARFGILLDRSRISRPASSDYIHRMVSFIESHAAQTGDARWALVVVDTASFGMARMAERLSASGRICAFFNMDEAKAWLAAPDQTAAAAP